MENFQEELFCLSYELNALSEISLKNNSERWIPGFLHQTTEYDHEKRYEFACKYVEDKVVLDIACGVGRGSRYLAQKGKAKHVIGCDLDAHAIRYANHRNADLKISYQINNAEEFIKENHFDTIVSFETIEHLKNYTQFLINIQASLKSGGLLIISTPISNQSINKKPANPYHVQEWGFKNFQNIISQYLFIKEIYVQLYHRPKQVQVKQDFFSRIKRSIYRRIKKRNPNTKESVTNFNQKYSLFEKYINQYPEDELGDNRIGYQVIIAQKDE